MESLYQTPGVVPTPGVAPTPGVEYVSVTMDNGIKLLALLGNPGAEYAETRHNAGWLLAAALLPDRQAWSKKFEGRIGEYPLLSGTIRLLCPETFMNLCGRSVRKAMDFYRLAPAELLVVHDELELPFGTTELRPGGGLGGHNGLRSLRQALGSTEFWRLRIGIGRPSHPNVAGYVLSRFTSAEREWLAHIWADIRTHLPEWISLPAQKKTVHFQ